MSEVSGEGCAQMGALADAHKKFAPFVGTFAAEVKLWMGPGEPEISTGVMENTLDLDGRSVDWGLDGGGIPSIIGWKR